jgi:hypothetical protein
MSSVRSVPGWFRAGVPSGVQIRHLLGDGAVAMAEGFFASRLADGSGRLDFPFAITAEMKGNLVSRIGEFYDTRPLVP